MKKLIINNPHHLMNRYITLPYSKSLFDIDEPYLIQLEFIQIIIQQDVPGWDIIAWNLYHQFEIKLHIEDTINEIGTIRITKSYEILGGYMISRVTWVDVNRIQTVDEFIRELEIKEWYFT